MNFVQEVSPRLDLEVGAGWCLKFVQDSFGAPVKYASATESANATTLRNASRQMPNVAVPVWFWHSGTYGGVFGEYGHVVIWVPGKGFLSSPLRGSGSQWFSSLEDIEISFNAKFRFWSLDINTLVVAREVPNPPSPQSPLDRGEEMFIVKLANRRWYLVTPNGAGKMQAVWLPPQSGASNSGIPIFDYSKAGETHMKSLRSAVSGL